MRFEGEEDAEVVEGQVTGRSEGPRFVPPVQARGRIYEAQPEYNAAGIDVTGLVDAGVGLATDPRSRTVALFVKVPLLAYVALHHKMPALVRLAALGLAVVEGMDLFQNRRAEVEAAMPAEWR